ncbi:MAG: hypothetical protein A3J47_02120 [Candidatus Yanofskybacteria bacterium RIFCSPHIGHO2_02_FULL_43_22]|uniref:Uncharacterized protein n=1 Tax=Candidatus Yanofskybacteria bacterium RIFCSPHIGHO2_02_FULL_43_22 TaxID=1802681 RepID=A0A1F8FLH9_9BACT|nr:MAG: hypothetical protein A3J47_02120 [Candidatus Yanofskybacteria bacterium RIFCSPHIGHO2_02_FULL_43_22]
MNTNELKKLLKGSTAVLILDNGEPSFVILGYSAYRDLLSDRPGAEVDVPLRRVPNGTSAQHDDNSGTGVFRHRMGEKESEFLERINKQILALKSEIDKEEKSTEISAVD